MNIFFFVQFTLLLFIQCLDSRADLESVDDRHIDVKDEQANGLDKNWLVCTYRRVGHVAQSLLAIGESSVSVLEPANLVFHSEPFEVKFHYH